MMNIKDLFGKVNAIDVVNEMINQHKDFYNEYDKVILTFIKDKYCKVIENLMNIRPNYKAGKYYTLLITYSLDSFDEDENNKDWFLSGNLYKNKDLEKIEYIPELYNLNINDVPSDKLLETINKYNKLIPQSYSYSMTEWNETLAYSINKLNVDEYGAETLLADYLWEITFYGINEDTIQVKRDELDKACKEIEILKNKSEEAKKNGKELTNEEIEELGFVTYTYDESDSNINDNKNKIITNRKSLECINALYRDLVYYYVFRK